MPKLTPREKFLRDERKGTLEQIALDWIDQEYRDKLTIRLAKIDKDIANYYASKKLLSI